jgi:hypothetical protein
MESEYIKRLEEENSTLRNSIHVLEDELAKAKLFGIDDMRKIIVSGFHCTIPTSTVMYGGQLNHIAGRSEIRMELEFDDMEVAVRLNQAIDGARNVK